MAQKNCNFYADQDDLLNLLEAFSELGEYKYTQTRSDLNEANYTAVNPVDILSYAISTVDEPERCYSFLVTHIGEEVTKTRIELRDGSGVRSLVGQFENPNSIALAFGGNIGDCTLIMSDIGTLGDTKKSVELHKQFKKLVTSMTKNVGVKGTPVRLMPGAMEKVKAGWRLAHGKDWSCKTDPQISAEVIAKS